MAESASKFQIPFFDGKMNFMVVEDPLLGVPHLKLMKVKVSHMEILEIEKEYGVYKGGSYHDLITLDVGLIWA